VKHQFVHMKPSQGVNPSAQPGSEQATAGEYPQGGSAQVASPQGFNQYNQPGAAIPPAAQRPITDPLNPPGNAPAQAQQNNPPAGSTPFASFHGIPAAPGQQMQNPFGAPNANASSFTGRPPAGVGWSMNGMPAGTGWSMNGISQPPMNGPTGAPAQSPSGSWAQPPMNGPMNGAAQVPMSGPLGAPPQSPSGSWPPPPMNGGGPQLPMSGPLQGGPAQRPMSGPLGAPPQPMTTRRPSQPLVLGPNGQPAMPMNGAPIMAPPQQPVGGPPGYLNVPTSPKGSDYFANPVAPVQRPNTGPFNNPNFNPNFNPNIGNMPPISGGLNNRPPAMPHGKRRRVPIWARVIIGVMVVLLILAGGGFWYYQTNYASFINASTGVAAIHHQIKDDGNITANQSTSATLTGGRINILLLGSDTDGKYNDSNGILQGTPLAQTDLIVTIDPQTGQVGMMSIPRDLQVTQSNTGGEYKLDEIFEHGVSGTTVAQRVGNAAGLVEDTLLYNYGIHINYYAWVSLQGFVKVIDTAGGVDIDAIHPMVDDNYPFDIGNNTGDSYAYERLYITPGPQHMNGVQALTYVRTRHSDLVGDFGRTIRQQQIISDLKLKLATPGIVGELPQLLQDLSGSLYTDMDLNTMLELANYAKSVNTANVQHITLGPPTYAVASQYGSNSNYYPKCQAIQAEIAQFFNLGNQANCIPQTDSPNAALIAPPAVPQRATPANTALAASNQGSTANQLTANEAMSALSPASNLNAYKGLNPEVDVHSMLDLLIAITCESLDGFQV
jgi:LCP family protein required for cell wall assembly